LIETFILAVVGSSHGLKGFVRVKSLSGETGHLISLKNVLLRQNGKEKTHLIEESQLTDDKSVLLMKFSGIDSLEQAKILSGAELIAARSAAAPLKSGEFYIEDLKGLAVIYEIEDSGEKTGVLPDSNARLLGHITDIIEGGNGELVEIRLVSGEKKLVPFRKEFFRDIDADNRTVVLINMWILE